MRALFAILGMLSGAGAPTGARPALFDYRSHPERYGSFEIRKDVVYGTGAVRSGAASKDLRADVFLPKGMDSSMKAAIVFVHGGGFVYGSKRDYHEECIHFARKGFVTVTVQYRLRGDAPPIPPSGAEDKAAYARAAVVDVKAALRWVHARAGDFGIDTANIFLHGRSAGAIAALAAGVTEAGEFAADQPGRPIPSANLPGASARVAGIVDFCGGLYGMVGEVDAGDPPILIYHGTEDRDVPFAQALALRDRCLEVGLEHEFHPIEGAGHCPARPAANGKTLRTLTHEFILKHLTVPAPPAGAPPAGG